jgi:hypothetical protein
MPGGVGGVVAAGAVEQLAAGPGPGTADAAGESSELQSMMATAATNPSESASTVVLSGPEILVSLMREQSVDQRFRCTKKDEFADHQALHFSREPFPGR